MVIPPVVNRFISVGELRAVAEHDFFCHFFLREKLVMLFQYKYGGI